MYTLFRGNTKEATVQKFWRGKDTNTLDTEISINMKCGYRMAQWCLVMMDF